MLGARDTVIKSTLSFMKVRIPWEKANINQIMMQQGKIATGTSLSKR